MLRLINLSFQGFNVFLKTEDGVKSLWLNSKETILVPERYISEQIKRMVQKKLFKLEGI